MKDWNRSTLEEMLFIQIKDKGLPAPRIEFKFHHKRLWRFDFAYPEIKLGIECDGSPRQYGRHNRGGGFENDCQKYNTAILEGWRVLRFTCRMIKSGEAITTIETIFSPSILSNQPKPAPGEVKK
jgi:very-short-patch-repair endonuclease